MNINIIPNFHPLYVHFTVALISTATACYLFTYLFNNFKISDELSIVARWSLWFGSIASIATIIAGFIAYYTVIHDTPSHAAMTIHRNWAIATFIAILSTALWSLVIFYKDKKPKFLFVSTMIAVFILTMITGWYGAEVVFKHGIGVQSLPKAEGPGHKHEHSDPHKD